MEARGQPGTRGEEGRPGRGATPVGPCEEQVEPPAWDHLRGFETLVSHAPPPRLLPRTVTSVTGLRPCALPTPLWAPPAESRCPIGLAGDTAILRHS